MDSRAGQLAAAADDDAAWLRTVFVAMASLGVTAGFSRFSFAIALPEMTDDLFRSYSTAGAVVALNFGTYFVAIIAVRRYGSHLDPSLLEKWGVAFTCVGLAVVAVAPDTKTAVLGTIVLGVAAGGGYVPGTSIIVSVAPAHRRGVAMGIGLAGIGLSVVLTGQILGVLERLEVEPAWRAAFLVEAAIGVVVLVLALAFLPRLTPFGGSRRPPRGIMSRLPGSGALIISYGLFGVAVSTYTGYLVAAARDRGFSQGHALLLSSLMGGAMAVALVVGRLSDSIGRRRTIVVGTLVLALSSFAVPSAIEPWIALTAVLAGAFLSGIGAAVGAYLGDHLTTAEVTATMSVLTLVMAATQIAAPPIGGWLADATGTFTATFGFATAAAVLSAVAASRLPDDQPIRRGGAGRGLRLPLVE